jgi:hypothetical protein
MQVAGTALDGEVSGGKAAQSHLS